MLKDEQEGDDDDDDEDCVTDAILYFDPETKLEERPLNEQCEYVKNNCEAEAIINFYEMYYCSFSSAFKSGRFWVWIPVAVSAQYPHILFYLAFYDFCVDV